MRSARSRVFPVLAVGLAFALAIGCGAEPPTGTEAAPAATVQEAGPPFDVLILMLDACRADRIGAFGYDRPTTPNLDAVAESADAVLYPQYYVEGNRTKTSTASLFTGLYTHQHGVRKGHEVQANSKWKTQALAEGHETLAERMKSHGYATFGVVKSRHLVAEYGFAQGFDTYIEPGGAPGDVGRVKETLRLLRELDLPLFGYVHLNACHHPFRERERHPAYMEVFGTGYDEAARIAAGFDFTEPEMKWSINRGDLELPEADARYLSILYDAQLRWVDDVMVGPIVAGLKASGRWDRTLLIVTADHGEELYEHSGYAHGHALWQEVVHVPLIVKFPAGRRPADLPDRVTVTASNVDLYPSIVSFLGHPVPEWLPGRPILERPTPGFAFSQARDEWMVVDGDDKLYVRGGTTHLFDLAADPGERRDLAAVRPDRVGELVQLGQGVFGLEVGPAGGAVGIETTLSDEALENLRSLGYIE